MNSFKSKLAMIGLSVMASAASAVTVYDGTVEGPYGSWGFVDFYYTGGTLAIDGWSNGFTKGPTGSGIADLYFSLFQNNGSARTNFTGTAIAGNDDGGSAGFGDGSTSSLDSYLNVGLNAGYYTLAVSSCCNNFAGVRNETILNSGIGFNRDYRLTFSQDVTLGATPPPVVPIVAKVTGTVEGPQGSWGFVDFTHNGGSLSINALAYGYTGGPTGQGIDDIYISIFTNDGSPRTAFTGNLVASNDDNNADEAFADGSTSALDSFINIDSLNPGNYTAVIGRCCNRFEYYRNEQQLFSGVQDGMRDYQLTFKGDVLVSAVPEPGKFALTALGLALVGGVVRRKRQG